MKEITIKKEQAGQTIYKFTKKFLSELPLTQIDKLFHVRDVKVNKVRVDKNYILNENDLVQIYVADDILNKYKEIKKENFIDNLNIIYEDENILIVNKPEGVIVVSEGDENRNTLTDMVQAYLKNTLFKAYPAHRIDRNTTGLVVFGKNQRALDELNDLFLNRDLIHKSYLALVCGITEPKGIIDKALFKDEKKGIVMVMSEAKGGKEAVTVYKAKEYFKKYTLVEASILTGRTHQIRCHMAYINHPLVGDTKYGDFNLNKEFESKFKYSNQFLHAYKIKFGELDGILSYLSNKEFVSPLFDKENKILEKLRSDKNQHRK